MSTSTVRLGLVGLGAMGMGHLQIVRELQPWAHVVALADSHRPFLERAAEQIPDAVTFEDPIKCIGDADVDAVIVATADHTHHQILQECISREIYVLCEKPLTTTARHSLDVVNAEHAAGRRLVQVGYMRRYDQDYLHIRNTLQFMHIGDPILISQRHRNPLAVNDFDADKLITSSAAHDIDLFRWLTGEDIADVTCHAKDSPDGATLTVLMTLQSPSGVLGAVELSRGPGLQYEIGMDIVSGNGALSLGRPPLTSVAMDDRVGAQRSPRTWIERFAGAYQAQDVAWITSVANRRIVGPSAYDGYATNAVIDAALAALRSGHSAKVAQTPAPVARGGGGTANDQTHAVDNAAAPAHRVDL
ncbi:Gfo/Idh/MocA family protein [Mycolicibacterium sp. P1-18]|uniref:Gfo/Idh/MocA family protein n=1 Tax=Mycolicibacterium sp. P1-18 TaxID=2024615 RepID=UPI001566A043|nr:Gfo/Idh/MocA family oxidoreductase [Mycolicibacterium sp. P1-18]